MRNHNLRYQLAGLVKSNREGSYSTQQARKKTLQQAAEQLKTAGYRQMGVNSLKPKHVDCLIKQWKSENLSAGTIKNRLAHVRWWADKVGKSSIMPKSNSELGIEKRSYIPETSKAKELDEEKLSKVTDQHTELSLRLQREFGLRREEAIKFSPRIAQRASEVVLKGSWTKGGKPRSIPIRTNAQRALLTKVSQLVGSGALIAPGRNYKDQMEVYKYQCSLAQLNKNHGLRHQYAQSRYLELMGQPCSVAGGMKREEMAAAQREADREARLIISVELGHEREQITNTYLGN